ncbi:hypothetical protein EW146_g3334 [Bondarzewia mesenterica]|uniref:polynucleotide adenylyltransferase n=1 Tax=Bondarzewia mesenterica TaxID=1095465 RepID=A0A4V3XFG8_9AGAM|nr:hypothetical protein EW146_g3334 [Bondarzewia mesenterica]
MAVYTPSIKSSQGMSQHLATANPPTPRRQASRQHFVADLSQCLFDFVIQLLPTAEELAVKEDVRKLLERLIRTIEPDSRLLSFGSTANGFSLRNSDMDLCCLIDSDERLAAADLVTMLGDLLERETKFHVKPLPHARIPIVKLSLDPSPGLPLGIACDIGFENRLALENTRLLYCYAMIDPTRVRTLVLFSKGMVQTSINSPYKGTLSSYGYVLLVIYFLVHVKNPPVLPNLQQMPPLRPISHADTHIGGNNTWFFDDIDLLRQRWQSANTESVAQLLVDFFKYFSRDFLYNTGVASIRAGLLKKESKGWQNDLDNGRYKDSREPNRLCIEDPFETNFNVARCVTRDGLYTIRGEFMRASRILASRPERAVVAIAQLCEERVQALGPSATSNTTFIPPRLSPIPPQIPYTVGSSPMRPIEVQMAIPDRISPSQITGPVPISPSVQAGPSRSPPEHMAARRGRWTSPPPPEAPLADHTSFENRLGLGLALATSSTDAREQETAYASSSNNSEILTDDEHFEGDEVRSVQSLSEQPSSHTIRIRAPGIAESLPSMSPSSPQAPSPGYISSPDPGAFGPYPVGGGSPLLPPSIRGRQWARLVEESGAGTPAIAPRYSGRFTKASRLNSPRRSISGPPRTSVNRNTPPSFIPVTHMTPLPPSTLEASPQINQIPHVFYQTDRTKEHIPRNVAVYPTPAMLHQYQLSQRQGGVTLSSRPRESQEFIHAPISNKRRVDSPEAMGQTLDTGPGPSPSATPTLHMPFSAAPSHSHSHSAATILAPTPPAGTSHFVQSSYDVASSSRSRSRTRSPMSSHFFPEDHAPVIKHRGSMSPRPSASTGSLSPVPSSNSSQYDASPLSTSPSSPHGVQIVRCVHEPPVLTEHTQTPPLNQFELVPSIVPTGRAKDGAPTDTLASHGTAKAGR